MAVSSEEYQKLVLDDLRTYAGLAHARKASLIERLLVRKARPSRLHPNPEDEFCDPQIGPNYEIVGKYANDIRNHQKRGDDPLDEPLQIVKMTPRGYGYMLVNGHHRWMAAWRMGLNTVPVRVVNVTLEQDIDKALSRTDHVLCASFDLDEVLLADGKNGSLTEKARGHLLSLFFRERIRRGAPALINELRRMGFDIWVYTGSCRSPQYLKNLFAASHFRVDGIVNGLRGAHSMEKINEKLSLKYEVTCHIDSKGLTCVNTRTHDYSVVDLTGGPETWASETVTELRKLPDITRLSETAEGRKTPGKKA